MLKRLRKTQTGLLSIGFLNTCTHTSSLAHAWLEAAVVGACFAFPERSTYTSSVNFLLNVVSVGLGGIKLDDG